MKTKYLFISNGEIMCRVTEEFLNELISAGLMYQEETEETQTRIIKFYFFAGLDTADLVGNSMDSKLNNTL